MEAQTAYSKPVTLKNILLFAVPTIAMSVFMSFYTMVDGLFVANLINTNALSAINLTAPVIQLVTAVSTMLATGGSAVIMKKMGEKKEAEARQDFTFLILVNVIVGLVMCGAGYALTGKIFEAMDLSPEVSGYCVDYLSRYLLFTVPILLMNNFTLYMIASEKAALSLVCSVSGGVLNMALDYVLIALCDLGIAGAAIASSVAELVSLVFFAVYTSTRIDWRRYDLFRRVRFRFRELGHILNLSAWTMVQQFVAVSTWFMFFVAVEHLGERPLAVTNIVRSISSLLFIIASSFATTSSSLVSNMIGAEQSRDVMSTVWRIVRMCYWIILPLMAIILIWPQFVLRIYTDNLPLIAASVPALTVMTTAYLFQTAAFIWFNTVSGTGNTRAAFTLEMIAIVTYALYVYLVVIRLRADVAWCWTTEHVYGLVMFSLAYLYMRKADWRSKRI